MSRNIAHGFTFYFCIGKWAGFNIFFHAGVRVLLGWVAIALIARDIETGIDNLYKQLDHEQH